MTNLEKFNRWFDGLPEEKQAEVMAQIKRDDFNRFADNFDPQPIPAEENPETPTPTTSFIQFANDGIYMFLNVSDPKDGIAKRTYPLNLVTVEEDN